MLVTDSLKNAVERDPLKIAIIDSGAKYSYGDFAMQTAMVRNILENIVKPGERVALLFENSADYFFAHYAVLLLGAVTVPIHPAISENNFSYIMNDSLPSVIIGQGRFLKKLGNLIEGNSTLRFVLQYGGGPAFKKETLHYGDFKANPSSPSFDACHSDTSTAIIMYTTGTTGKPKGVELSHANLMAAAQNINEFMGIGENEREVVPIPFSHSFGLGRTRCLFAKGGTLIIETGLQKPEKIIDSIIKNEATGFSSVPAGFAMLLNRYADMFKQCQNFIKYVEIGSAPMSLEHKKLLMEMFPEAKICMHYGLTEASRSSFIEFSSEKNKLNSVGKPSPNVRIRIVNNAGESVACGQNGTILISAETVMKGYWNKEDDTRKALTDGWLNTGDIGCFDEDGYLYLIGRKRDVINVGGFKVMASEVEDVLKTYEGVQESAVVGIKDPKDLAGEVIKAFVVPKCRSTVAELKQYCMKKLEPWKVPYDIVFVTEIPKTASGKIQKHLLAGEEEHAKY